jgi:hypothetical protein
VAIRGRHRRHWKRSTWTYFDVDAGEIVRIQRAAVAPTTARPRAGAEVGLPAEPGRVIATATADHRDQPELCSSWATSRAPGARVMLLGADSLPPRSPASW